MTAHAAARAVLGVAALGVPMLLDGVGPGAAALVATALTPGATYWAPRHRARPPSRRSTR